MNCVQVLMCLVLACAGSASSFAQESSDIHSPRHKAWDLLVTAILSKRASERTNGVRALGLLRDSKEARDLAENELKDSSPDVRKAAATALGQMLATQSIPQLEEALADPKIPVVMAAAQSLRELKQPKSAYEVCFELLMGERKSNDGVIARQLETLKDPKELAKIGISEGIGYIPFAGIGWDAYRTMNKKNPNPVRAEAARMLAHDPDPAIGKALIKATEDKDWIVRAAAVEAIAQRGDPSLLPQVVDKFRDKNPHVRYSAAAAVIRLSAIEPSKSARNDR
jgi:HEAT repeat protein